MERRNVLSLILVSRCPFHIDFVPSGGQRPKASITGCSGDAGEHVGEPGLRIDVVKLACDDQGIHGGSTLAAGSESANSQDLRPRAIPRSVRSATLLVMQIRPSSRKRVNASHRLSMSFMPWRLGDIVMTRHLCTFGTHPDFELGDDRAASFLTRGPAGGDIQTVDGALDVEQDVDLAEGFQAREGKSATALSLSPVVGRSFQHRRA